MIAINIFFIFISLFCMLWAVSSGYPIIGLINCIAMVFNMVVVIAYFSDTPSIPRQSLNLSYYSESQSQIRISKLHTQTQILQQIPT
jgi:hypothetical protein